MRAWCTALAVLVAAVTSISVASAGAGAAKQRVAINIKFHTRTFLLSPFNAGALKRDTGTMTQDGPDAACRDVVRDGQKIGVCNGGRWTLDGKRGTLTIRTRENWVDPGSGGCGVAFGTWKVVRGTGVRESDRRRAECLRRSLSEVVRAPRGLPHHSVAH